MPIPVLMHCQTLSILWDGWLFFLNLVGIDGNAHCIMGYVSNAIQECGKSDEERAAYYKDATSSNYDHLLGVSVRMVDHLNQIRGLDEFDDEDDDL
jgi:hypothetical protein